MRGFLLDSHVPGAVIDGVRAARPACWIEHLARWRGGTLRNARDEMILAAVHDEELVLVTYDVGSIPATLHTWLAQGRPIPAVALLTGGPAGQNDIRRIIRCIVSLYDEPSRLDPAYPVLYLRPS